MPFTVIAREGLDVAHFGEARESLKERLGPYETFRRTPEASPTDRFPALGLFLDYDKSDYLNFIEVALPGEVFYGSVALLARNYREVVLELEVRGLHGVEDDSGIEYSELGLALFNPSPGESDSVIEGVTLFAP